MEVLENFGVNWSFFIAQLVNFTLLFFLLKHFLYKPILDMLEKRRVEIEEGLANAKKMNADAKKFEEEHALLLTQSKKESQTIIENAVVASEKMRDQILKEAADKSKEMIAVASKMAQEEKQKMLGEVKAEVLTLTTILVEKILHEKMDSEHDKKFIQKILNES